MDLSSGITRLSISNDLPDEIWQLIFHEAVTVPAETIPILHGVWWLQWLISPYTLTYWPGKPWKLSLSTRLTITLVCRRWYSIGIAFLYRTIYLAQGLCCLLVNAGFNDNIGFKVNLVQLSFSNSSRMKSSVVLFEGWKTALMTIQKPLTSTPSQT